VFYTLESVRFCLFSWTDKSAPPYGFFLFWPFFNQTLRNEPNQNFFQIWLFWVTLVRLTWFMKESRQVHWHDSGGEGGGACLMTWHHVDWVTPTESHFLTWHDWVASVYSTWLLTKNPPPLFLFLPRLFTLWRFHWRFEISLSYSESLVSQINSMSWYLNHVGYARHLYRLILLYFKNFAWINSCGRDLRINQCNCD
jgi:hypothetical protein